jgi:hypothetical protein
VVDLDEPIVSSYDLNDRVVDLDEFLWVARAVIFVNVPSLELFWPDDLSERCSQSLEITPP